MKDKLIILYAPNINGLGAKIWLEAKIKQLTKKNQNWYCLSTIKI